ncbi:MAG TPA: ABC-F family ATP-binding cassette domain-containing protein [Chitinophagales bacterium]|nr:ABC-F family ATP-binding cassette domain-containing protein [Chitinophagales bacterium]
MNYLYAENISKSFGDKELFRDITISINKGQRIALVAKNGFGKTSLLHIIAGLEPPDNGSVLLRKDLTVGFLEQEALLDENKTIIETIFDADNAVVKAVKFYELCLEENADSKKMQEAMEQMDLLQAWDFESKAQQILSKLSVGEVNRKIGTLSGGQKKRVGLASVLLHEPEFLILDEPTNHLDLDMIEWLEEYLKKNYDTLLIVTHDRDFLDNVCNEVVELDDGKLFFYTGNYETYVEKKTERKENDAIAVDKAKNLLRKELEWMRRQPKARTVKAKSRIDSFYEIKEEASKDLREKELKAEIKINRLGGKIVDFHHVHKKFDQLTILSDFSYKFKHRERLGIAGRNGIGKTTFLNLITGQEKPDAGKIVIGETVQFGYYTQKGMKIKDDQRVIEVIRDIADYITLEKGKTLSASQLLERFLFDRNKQYDYVAKLSGGEKRRLYLLTILMKNPNFLILDEPTNDLDIITQNVLEDFLEEYPGCLVVVSHDRHFMKKITDHLLVFEGNGKVVDFPGTYAEYLFSKNDKKESAKSSRNGEKQEAVAITTSPKPKIKRSYKEQREFETLEKEIAKLEQRKNELTTSMQSADLPFNEMQKLSREFTTVLQSIDEKSMRWLELSEIA